ncbi:alpha/beta hydrolase [Sporosarcina luteola]|uniref:alpha/beta fold hydrolase n=1 Tax=Sporosarcina luteola TaxID=582850 RepID=UPI00203D0E13|nr:alpha/beta hydrolase [Sporosarcina luteola]MCM3744022.1 alpha/beta hydrolase [Sporosarcina luteola]
MNQHIIKRNHVQVSGSGERTIVFAHGLGCDQTVWKNIVPAFAANYRVVLFDYVGAGRSDASASSAERYSSLHGYAQDLLEVCDALQLENIIFVGHSVSGMIGSLAAIQRPGLFDKLIMIGASPCYLNEPGYNGGFELEEISELLDMMEINYNEWAKYLAPIAMLNEEKPELTAEFEMMLNANSPVIARQFAEATFMSDHRHDLQNIPVRTLIIQTKEDAIAPLEVAQYLHRHIPNSELSIMETAKGHNPHISHPEETVQEIKRIIG